MQPTQSHPWNFIRVGGFDQVTLDRSIDLERLGELDQKLWVALACPTTGLEFDERTLAVVDANSDQRIRAPEVVAATQWMCKVLKDPSRIGDRSDTLPLGALNLDDADAAAVYESAEQIITELGKRDLDAISIDDIVDTQAVFAATRFNGDGIIPPSAARREDIALAIEQVVASVGGVDDSNGEAGVTLETVETFFTAAAAYATWWEAVVAEGDAVLPLGDKTAAALATIDVVNAKVEDYFARCKAAAFDARSIEHLAGSAEKWAEIAKGTIGADDEAIADFPLATVTPGAALPLGDGLNPAWASRVDAVRQLAIEPLLGELDQLTLGDWRGLVARFDAHRACVADKAGAEVEALGVERLQELLSGSYRADIEALIAADEELRPEAEALEMVDRTVRLYRDLDALLNNFVSFRDFYSKRDLASFQVGTLFLDGRSCDLVIAVEDAAKHAPMAAHSYINLAYCTCTHKSTGKTRTVAAAFTDGDSDFLTLGRNGVFYDRDGVDWDATIVKIAANPISIRQAFWSPYKRVAKFIEAQLQKFAASKDKAADGQLSAGVSSTQAAAKPAEPGAPAGAASGAPAPAPAFDIGKFAGIFAAVGLAVGALAAAGGIVIAAFLSLTWWQMPLALAGVLLLISGPSMILAWLKLRQRNLAPLLDASGWAINARAKLSVPFGATLTHIAQLPDGSKRSLDDPYAPKRSTLPWLIALLAVAVGALWYLGYLAAWWTAIAG